MFSASFEAALKRQLERGNRPPIQSWNPSRVADMDLHIAADGRWIHEGKAIERAALVQLFATILRLDEDGYCLVTPIEKQRITVADAPFQALELHQNASASTNTIQMRTNVDDIVTVGARHPIWLSGQPHQIPYVMIRDGLHARISRNVYYQLLEDAEIADDRVFLVSGGRRFLLGDTV